MNLLTELLDTIHVCASTDAMGAQTGDTYCETILFVITTWGALRDDSNGFGEFYGITKQQSPQLDTHFFMGGGGR